MNRIRNVFNRGCGSRDRSESHGPSRGHRRASAGKKIKRLASTKYFFSPAAGGDDGGGVAQIRR